ncbi:hypothetical protein N7467_004646 [Penicillium canescens]|nr:hypothetical protein N7467_004646 [Penicillium canescens]
MGLSVEGPSIGWATTEQAGPSVRKWATEQLICLWNKQRHRSDNVATWGDEIEYNLVDLDHGASRATMLLDQERVIREWEKDPASEESPLQWEGAKYVVETTPAKPYTGSIEDLLSVQANIYDQLIPLAPIFLAMTTAVPIWKGYLVDTDVRWQRFGDLVDDRRPEEMEHTPPRWTCNRTYLSQGRPPEMESNTPLQPMDETIKQSLLDGDMDEQLATHFASILSRDPLVLTQEDMCHFNTSNTKLFELLHGCTWHAVRLNHPFHKDNAAFAIFTYLLSRAIVTLHLNFYIPIDKVGESMEFANKRNAVLEERMWFRRSGWLTDSAHLVSSAPPMCKEKVQSRADGEYYALMSADEIFNGELDHRGFPGLIPLVRYYLDYSKMPESEQERISPYLDVISKRASGEMPTPASWMREFVRQHGDYQQDSYVSESVCYDIMKEIVRMNEE